MKKALFILTMLSAIVLQAQKTWDVTNHGVVEGDTSLNQQKLIQSAVDKCSLSGGGTVYFPPGDYMSGSIQLKDNVSLHLEAGATLYASLNETDYQNDYIVYKQNSSGKEEGEGTPVLIYAKDAHNISIKGLGRIHGRARREYLPLEKVDGFIRTETELAKKSGVEMKIYYKVRPYTCMIFLESCSNVLIRDITLEESTDWTLHFKWSSQIVVDGVKIFSDLEKGVNADGIDIDGCKDVLVSNCIIKTGDDAIVLKSTSTDGRFESCENVTVTSCSLVSTSTALKLGTESFGDFRHILFSNCIITNSNRGLGIIIRDGGTASDIQFSNITIHTDRKHFNWWGNGDPIWIVIKKRYETSKIGSVENVRFDNIYASGQGTSKLEGFDGEHPLRGISISSVQIQLQPEDYPDKRSSRILQANDVDGLKIHNSTFKWNGDMVQKNWSGNMFISNASDLRLSNLELSSYEGQHFPEITMENCSEALITNVESSNNIEKLIAISGNRTKHLILKNLDLMNRSLNKVTISEEVNSKEVKQL